MALAAVVIPAYYNSFTYQEKCALNQCRKILGEYETIFVIPEHLEAENDLVCEGVRYIRVPAAWMDSIESYSQMCCCVEFYEMFQEYEYILIYQLDAFVFEDKLSYFCHLGYDYYGAPWLKGTEVAKGEPRVYVGNGGFSLRKVRSAIRVLQRKAYRGEVEDVFWAQSGSEFFHIAPVDVALQFSFEMDAETCYQLNDGQLPFGCHAWSRLNMRFWAPFIQKAGYSVQEMKDTFERTVNWIGWEISRRELAGCMDYDPADKKIFIWGTKEEGVECGYFLHRIGAENFEYIDSRAGFCGKKLWGRMIHLPEVLDERGGEEAVVIIAAKRYEEEIFQCLKEKGVAAGNVLSYDRIAKRIEDYILDTWIKAREGC